MSAGRKHCYVIMPFTQTSDKHTEEYWTNHFESFLKPTIEECPNLEAHRSEARREDILRQIITDLIISPIVVAELTDLNPNVFWELGVRQSFKHGTVTIAEHGTKIPFDLSIKGTLFHYPNDHIKNMTFIKQFKRAIMDCLSHPDVPDSHVLETISGRGTIYQIIRKDEVVRRVDALTSECKWNTSLLNAIYEKIEENKKKTPETWQMVSTFFRSSAIEFLLINRYLDEDTSFYSTLESSLVTIDAMNDQLRDWARSSTRVEEWFLRTRETLMARFKKCEEMVTDLKNRITASSY